MARRLWFSALIFCLGALISCSGVGGGSGGGGGTAPPVGSGSLEFHFDLGSLASAARSAASVGATITSTTVTLTRTDHATVVKSLTVANNVATGRVDDLAVGYWHVHAKVFQDQTLLYDGEADVSVVAGVVTRCAVLFDPIAPPPPLVGSIDFQIGINPLPGYRLVAQTVSDVLVDAAAGKLYMLDSTASVIAVYDANTLVRERDIVLAQAPLSMAFKEDRTGIYLGYSTGSIYLLDIAAGTTSLAADALMPVSRMLAFGGHYVLALGNSGSGTTAKSFDVTTGQLVDTKSTYYATGNLEWSPAASTAYFEDINVSPVDLFRIRLDLSTGTIGGITDSPYHGDYSLGFPMRIIQNGTRLATSSGNMFTCSSVDTEDLKYAGKLAYAFIDLAVDDANGYLYALGNDAVKKLLVLDQSTLFLSKSVELLGTPKRVFQTDDAIIVLIDNQGQPFARVWNKADLGL